MRIWLVNLFDPIPGESFRPGRYAFLCNRLAEAGHDVTWWSSDFFHALKQKRSQGTGRWSPRPNLQIILLPTPPYKTNTSLFRLYSHYAFARQFAAASVREPAPELIVASFPPIGSSLEATRYAIGRGVRVVLDVQDLWPETFELLAPSGLRRCLRPCFKPFRRAAREAFGGAHGIIGVSRTYVEYGLRHAGRKIPSLVLPLGVDLEAFDEGVGAGDREVKRLERSAIYVGTIGLSYDLRTIIEAASMTSSHNRSVVFGIAGSGPELLRLREMAERRGLGNVIFHGMLPFREMTSVLRRSMVGLHCIASGSPQTLTNKLFDYMAAGLPVINSSPGEVAELIEREAIGVTYTAGDAAELSRGLELILKDRARWEEMSFRARRLAVERYDRRLLYPALETYLRQVVDLPVLQPG